MVQKSRLAATKGYVASLPPLLKLGLWLAMIIVGAAMIQAAAWLLAPQWSILSRSRGGHAILLALALGTLAAMMALDQRPAGAYGFAVGRQWKRLLLSGFGLGVGFYAGYCAVCGLLGVYAFHLPGFAPGRAAVIVLAALAAFPAAVVQQAIFSGYLFGILRDRYGRVLSTLVPAILFAVLSYVSDSRASLTDTSPQMFVGMFLIALLLGVLRLQTGGILFPAGVLAGCMFVRRLIRKGALLIPVNDSPLSAWLAVDADPRRSPAFWLLLSLGIAAGAYWVWRRGEAKAPESQPVWDRDFKRVFPLSNNSMFAPLDVWLGRLVAARFRVGLDYVPRLVAILIFSAVNTLLSLPERLLLPLLLRWKAVPDPVFILGVHRSGTTHLQNMLAQDPQFATARAYHIMNPAGFCLSGWLIAPLWAIFLPCKRPMDGVRFHVFAPQEEEFILAGISRLSPYWGVTFPEQRRDYDRFILPQGFSARELRSWKAAYLSLLRRLLLFSGRRPLLKNPYNTGRVAMLRQLFPKARFIHIFRHPYAVYRSNMHMAREYPILNQLQDAPGPDDDQARLLENYRAMEDAFYQDAAELPAGQVSEVRFEDLETDPVREIRRIYAELGLELSPQYLQRLQRYLQSLEGYQKNRFQALEPSQREAVDAAMAPYFRRWGYPLGESSVRRAA